MKEKPSQINSDFWDWFSKQLIQSGLEQEYVREEIDRYKTNAKDWYMGENDYKRVIFEQWRENHEP